MGHNSTIHDILVFVGVWKKCAKPVRELFSFGVYIYTYTKEEMCEKEQRSGDFETLRRREFLWARGKGRSSPLVPHVYSLTISSLFGPGNKPVGSLYLRGPPHTAVQTPLSRYFVLAECCITFWHTHTHTARKNSQ